MTYTVNVAKSAEKDIQEVSDVIAYDYCDPMAATRLVGRIFDGIDSLSEMPNRYSLSSNPLLAAVGCRQTSVGNFLILYMVDEEELAVNVVAIVYCRRSTDFVKNRI